MKPVETVLEKMLLYTQKIEAFTQGIEAADFYANDEKQYAVSLALLQIGELVALLPDTHRERYADVPWKKIRGLRNIIAHQYGTIDDTLLWTLIQQDIPQLARALQKQMEASDI